MWLNVMRFFSPVVTVETRRGYRFDVYIRPTFVKRTVLKVSERSEQEAREIKAQNSVL